MRYQQSHERNTHIYIVGRVWREAIDQAYSLKLNDLTLTKAFLTEDAADQEAARLNKLNGKQWVYFVRIARLVPESSEQTR